MPRLILQTHAQVAQQQRMLKLKKARLAKYLNMGLNMKESCILAEVSDHYLGLLRSDPAFEQFIQRCLLEGKANDVGAIKSAGKSGIWQAAAWHLERKYPDEYGKKETIRHEWQIKVITFRKVVLEVLNEVDPLLAMKVMQKLRAIDVDGEVIAQQMASIQTNQPDIPLLPPTTPGESWE